MGTGFFGGFAEGFQTGANIAQARRKDKREEEQFELQKQEVQRKRDREDQARKIADEIAQERKDRANGTGYYGQFRNDAQQPRNGIAAPAAPAPDMQAGAAPQQNGVEVRPFNPEPLPQGTPLPADGSEPQRGIATPGSEQNPMRLSPEAQSKIPPVAVEGQQEPREQNIFKSGGEGLYKNQRQADQAHYSRLEELYTKLYSTTGEYDKLATVTDSVKKMRDIDYDAIRKTAAAGLISGNVGAFNMVNRAMSVLDLGFQVDSSKATYDPKTQTYTGLRFVDEKGNVQENQSMTTAAALGLVNQMDPASVLKYQADRADQSENAGLKREEIGVQREKVAVERDQNKKWYDVQMRNLRIKEREQSEIKSERQQATNDKRTIDTIQSVLKLDKEPAPLDESKLLTLGDEEAKRARAEHAARVQRFETNVNIGRTAMRIYEINDRKIGGASAIDLSRYPFKESYLKQNYNGDGTSTVDFQGKKYRIPFYPE